MTAHEITMMSSQAGWLAGCSCGWRAEDWHRAKNSAGRDAKDHVRGEAIAAGKRARANH